MFVLITYDVPAERTDIYRKLLRSRLEHLQQSVFYGDITEGQLVALLKSDLISRYHGFRRVKPRKSSLVWRSISSTSSSSVVTWLNKRWGSMRASPPAAGSPAGFMSFSTVFGSKRPTATVKRRIG
ncbi:CRISPR-associated endonuclease Cas2 [Halorubrum ezzemoulense]|uniref:CRISPR-associated endonuclease Cas2 n=1 Tax=Halorubrum ezzemoulense TaxID=337243 RepID=UPI00232BD48B|nr:CRISPR-associated endonuclease Cas2 [Halorubrum ezzemoulense]MDB2226242.1 CRISPR-associated endonuclease Cas2 [Halorubrum ezzemoulense]